MRPVHCVSIRCDAPAETAFAYLADPARLGEWALGCWGGGVGDDGLVRGTSLFDGSQGLVRVVPVEASLGVDFEVGDDPERLVRRIAARVVPGHDLGGEAGTSLVVLLAWRTEAMDDERWRRLETSHEAEILILRERIERVART